MAILKTNELDIISHSEKQSKRLGTRLGALLQPDDIICLSGEMGAGKTVFTTGIGEGWGTKVPVTSPTYALVHQHSREKDKQKLHHLDCYRLDGIIDAESIGLDDILDGGGIVIFEWAERIEEILPEEHLWIDLRVVEATRRNFIFEGRGERYTELIEKFKESAFGV